MATNVENLDFKRVTTGDVEENGTFDVLMKSISGHIEKQFDEGRITGDNYANVYLGAMQFAIQNAVQFTLEEREKNQSAELLYAKTDSEVENKRTLEQNTIAGKIKNGEIAYNYVYAKAYIDFKGNKYTLPSTTTDLVYNETITFYSYKNGRGGVNFTRSTLAESFDIIQYNMSYTDESANTVHTTINAFTLDNDFSGDAYLVTYADGYLVMEVADHKGWIINTVSGASDEAKTVFTSTATTNVQDVDDFYLGYLTDSTLEEYANIIKFEKIYLTFNEANPNNKPTVVTSYLDENNKVEYEYPIFEDTTTIESYALAAGSNPDKSLWNHQIEESAKKADLYEAQTKGFLRNAKQKLIDKTMDTWSIGYSSAPSGFSIPNSISKPSIDSMLSSYNSQLAADR